MMKPKVFIGSSAENLDAAYAMQENLEHQAEITVWTQGIFELSNYSLDSLIDTLENIDFGIFVLSPDDVIKLRGQEYQAVRDNVIFELGLFIGKLGKGRNFIVIPRGCEDFHLPTDLLGLTPATFDPNRGDRNLNAALGPACRKITKAMQKLGQLSNESPTSSGVADLKLAQGEETFDIHYYYSTTAEYIDHNFDHDGVATTTWNAMFRTLSPHMIDEASDRTLAAALTSLISTLVSDKITPKPPLYVVDFDISEDDFLTVKVHLRALGLIKKSERQRDPADKAVYWTLTSEGDKTMTGLRVIRTT